MIAHGFPPDEWRTIPKLLDLLIHFVRIHFVLKLDARVTMPALDKVHEVQHDDKGYGNIVIASLACSTTIAFHVRVCRLCSREGRDGTPEDDTDTGIDDNTEHQALPVGISTQTLPQGLLDRLLLKQSINHSIQVTIQYAEV